MNKTSLRNATVIAAVAAALFATESAQAVTSTWTGTTNGTWDTTTAANWGGTAFTSGNDALFSGTPTNNVTAATGLTIGAITLDSTFTGTVTLTGANTVSGATTISGGTLALTNSGGLGASAATVNTGAFLLLNAGNVTYSNAILGSGTAKVITGNGDVILTGSMASFTGTLDLNQSVGSASKTRFTTTQANLISSSATINVNTGTTLYLNQGLNYGAAVQLFGAGNTENLGALRLENAAIQTGSVTLRANSFIGVNSSGATISGVIGESGGSFGFTKQGNNVLTLSGSNNYSGTTTISAGTVSVGNNSALGTGSVAISGGSLSDTTAVTLANNFTLNNATTFTAGSGTMALNGNVTGTPNGSWNLTPTNKITLGGSNSLTLSANTAGMIVNAGAGGLDITGTTTISGASGNTFSGYFNIQGTATVTVQSSGSFTINGTANASKPDSVIGQNTAGTSTLVLNGGSLTVGTETGFALGNNIATANGVLTISSGTATINRGSTTATDNRSFIALGRDLGNGTINLNGGTLATDRNFVRDGGSAGGANGGTANFVFGGGTLKALANQTDWLNSALINTYEQALSSVTTTSTASTIDANGFSVAINSAISGVGGFNINSNTGTGTVTFGGTSTYSGGTTISSGTLALGHATNTLADAGAVAVNGGTLDMSNHTDTVGAITSTGGTFASTGGAGVLTGSSLVKTTAATTTVNSGVTIVAAGSNTVQTGTLIVNGVITGSEAVSNGGTLGGSGTVSGAVSVTGTGILAAGNSPGILSTGDLTLSGTLAEQIAGTTAGTGYDQVNVTGAVTLGGTISLSLLSFTPTVGDLYFIVNNDSTDTVSGLLNSTAQGGALSLGGQSWLISYTGNYTGVIGTSTFTGGNDVVLQAVPEPSSWAMMFAGLGMLVGIQRFRRPQM